jgi:uncharacterized protein (TIGR02646 family)
MIRIHKKTEPIEWTRKNKTPGLTNYEAIPELRDALLDEQGYLCAYCMRRIPHKDEFELYDSKIEHVKSRTSFPTLQREYNNMVICCSGNINGSHHCDKSKDRLNITFSPFDNVSLQTITYSSKDGEIKSSQQNMNNDLNSVLGLNNTMLKANRLQTMEGVRIILEKKKWKKAQLEIKLTEWNTKENQKLKPYCGIVIWYLEKKLKQY